MMRFDNLRQAVARVIRGQPRVEQDRERAGWQDWACPTCGRRWYLEHYHAEDGRYLGCSWMGQVAERRRGRR